MRGSAVRRGDDERPGVHVLGAFAGELRRSIGALTVPPDSGEMVEALRLIRELPVRDCPPSQGEEVAAAALPEATACQNRQQRIYSAQRPEDLRCPTCF